jgi:hypothetical protein
VHRFSTPERTRAWIKETLSDPTRVAAVLMRGLEVPRTEGPVCIDRVEGHALCLIYWPPEHRSTPHMHTAWTVGGVLSNEIRVATFEEIDGQLRLLATHRGRPGDVGGITRPPCIHMVENPTDRTSITMHVFAPGAGEKHFHDPRFAPARMPPRRPWRYLATLEALEALPAELAATIAEKIFWEARAPGVKAKALREQQRRSA